MARSERLREMERLYVQQAYSDIEMAERLRVDRTTAYKDRILLETEVPFIQDELGRWKIDRTRYLSAIRVNLDEALALYLAARRASRQTRISQLHVASGLEKLASALRQPMTERLVRAAGEVLAQAAQPERVAVLETIARGWVEARKVRITHQALRSRRAMNYLVSPYLIEPSLWGDGAYLIGESDVHGRLATFKIERIESASLTDETFSVPADFDEGELLKHAWGIWYGDEEPVTVILRFAPGQATRRVKESIWHPTQTIAETANGGCLWTAQVAEWQEMVPWVRGWGADCEVLEPEELRGTLRVETRRLVRLYGLGKVEHNSLPARLLRCWGKTGRETGEFHPAVFHMLDVGHVARELLGDDASPRWRRVLGGALGAEPGKLADWLPWLVALHDIGKISAPFQEQRAEHKERLLAEGFSFGARPWNNDPYHTFTGQVFLAQELSQLDAIPLPDSLLGVWREMVGGHHGQFAAAGSLGQARTKLGAEESQDWARLRVAAAGLLKEHLLRQPPQCWPEPANISGAIMALTGFTILCDWLGSDGARFPMRPEVELEEYVKESARRAREAVEGAGFFQASRSAASTSFASLFPNLQPPRPLQAAIDQVPIELLSGPCLAIIEAPTGEGKTEAALALAHRLALASGSDELYYALPTTATSNQMFRRLKKYLRDSLGLATQARLIHGQAFLFEDDLRIEPLDSGEGWEPGGAREWFGPKKRALLAPFGVGTIDQAELAALNVRHTALRLIGLAGKVVIVDEVHAYDTYMTTIIERLLNWLAALGTSVIILSATLPVARRASLVQAYGLKVNPVRAKDVDYPGFWVVGRTGSYHASPPAYQPDRHLRLNTLSLTDEDPENKACWLLQAVAGGGCACWITNTVARAQRMFAALDKIAPPDVDRLLIHSQFPLEDRQSLERLLAVKYGPEGSRPERGIVVGTQLLEQSLDLDFDVMVSDLAPVDLLLQRAGRLHRHEATKRPPAHSVPRLWINVELAADGSLQLGVDQYVYDEFILRQTWRTLAGREEITLPADYRPLVEAIYAATEPPTDTILAEAWEKLQDQERNAVGQARLRLLPEPDPEDPFCGLAASRGTFEENESSAAWIVAQTRLAEESVTVIPLERNEASAWFFQDGGKLEMSLASPVPRETQLQLLRRSLRVTHRRAVPLLKAGVVSLPRLFTESLLLKECIPLWLQRGQSRLPSGKETLVLTLDPRLGLVIDRERRE